MANDIMDRHNNNEMNDIFNNMGRWFDGNFNGTTGAMKTDISESKDNYNVKIDLPDMNKKDIAIDYDKDVLTFSAHRDTTDDDINKNGDMIMSERSYGRYSRQYRLPNVDRSKISAKYENGTLNVTLPKEQQSEGNGSKIEIN